MEQTLKERIIKLDKELGEVKKELRAKTEIIDDLNNKLADSDKQ